jgi:hypothetical protein
MYAQYSDFDLLILPGQRLAYQARVVVSPVGQANSEFDLPFAEPELKRFFWLSGRDLRQLRPAPKTEVAITELTPRQFGERLFAAVFSGAIGACLLRSLDEAHRNNKGLRLRLRLDAVPEIADLPWEFLFSSDLNRYFALSDQTPIVRYLDLPQREQNLGVQTPLHILTVVSNPQGVQPLDVEGEWSRLQVALADLHRSKRLFLERLPRATVAALQGRLRQTDAHILHFIGHGVFDADNHVAGLSFEDEAGKHMMVTAEQLGTLLNDQKSLRLVYLNACETGRNHSAEVFSGVAQTLVRQGILAVLAMQFAVSDVAAQALSYEFYRALADGAAVDTAVSEARKALFVAGDELEWATPVLFSRSPDGHLFADGPSTDLHSMNSPLEDEPAKNEVRINIATETGAITNSQISIGNIAGRDIHT